MTSLKLAEKFKKVNDCSRGFNQPHKNRKEVI